MTFNPTAATCIRANADASPLCGEQCQGCSFMQSTLEMLPLSPRTEVAAIEMVARLKRKALDETWEPHFRAGLLYACEVLNDELTERSDAASPLSNSTKEK